jgi:hypothetical protein
MTAAGLLRPEAWLLAAVYLAYLLPGARASERPLLVAIAVSAPIVWATMDFAVTGDPLFSLHGTQELAAQLDRPRHVGTGLTAAPAYLKFILQNPIMLGGVAGCGGGLYLLYERSILPTAITGLGLLSFLILSLADLPLLVRYLLLPAAMLALFFAVAAFGWLNVPQGTMQRRVWLAACPLVVLLLLLSVPRDRDRLSKVRRWADTQEATQSDLRDLAGSSSMARWRERCPRRIFVPTHGIVPSLAYWLDEPASHFVLGPAEPGGGLFISPASAAVAATVTLDPNEPRFDIRPPPTFERVASNRSWILYARCSRRPA